MPSTRKKSVVLSLCRSPRKRKWWMRLFVTPFIVAVLWLFIKAGNVTFITSSIEMAGKELAFVTVERRVLRTNTPMMPDHIFTSQTESSSYTMMSEHKFTNSQTHRNSNSTISDHTLNSQRKYTSLTEVHPHRMYLFSAVLKNVSKQPDTAMFRYDVILAGWLHKNDSLVDYKCCVWMKTEEIEIIAVNGTQINRKETKATLLGVQIRCSLTHSASSILGVTMATRNSTCPLNVDLYLKPYSAGPAKPGLAVCSKIGYWSLDAKYLVEWFEIVRLLGASKVISYTYELNDDAMRVLRYYEDIGYADVYEFDFPDTEKLPRKINQKNGQCWNDKAVAVYDCVQRLASYDYVTIMDKDELIVPETERLQGALLEFVKTQLEQQPKLGQLTFKTQMHHITGEPLKGNTMYTDHYHRCSTPIKDRQKNIYLPSRAVSGRVSTHWLAVSKGYKSVKVSEKLATIHHYRTARATYFGGIKDLGQNMSCTVMQRLSEMVRNSTTKIRTELGLI